MSEYKLFALIQLFSSIGVVIVGILLLIDLKKIFLTSKNGDKRKNNRNDSYPN